MSEDIRDHVELIAQTCLFAEQTGREGAVTAIEIDPQGTIILPVRVKDDDWRLALASVPQLIAQLAEEAGRPALLLFCFGIGDVDYLYDQASMDQVANAVMSVHEAPGGDAGSRDDVEIIRRVSEDLERRNIALTLIGEQFAWIFDRSKSTFVGVARRDAKPQPPVFCIS